MYQLIAAATAIHAKVWRSALSESHPALWYFSSAPSPALTSLEGKRRGDLSAANREEEEEGEGDEEEEAEAAGRRTVEEEGRGIAKKGEDSERSQLLTGLLLVNPMEMITDR